MVSPPKPWERGSQPLTASASPAPPTSAPISTQPVASTSTTAAGAEPARPSLPQSIAQPSTSANSLLQPGLSAYNRTGYSPFGSNYGGAPFGTSAYGGYGGYGGVGGYGGFGSYGGMGMGGYGGFGNMGYGGMNGMMGPNGPFDPNNPSLTQALETTTQSTFALLHSIVQTFSGMAQMLESTFMATHSSFFAMVGLVDQFSQLRNALGSVLGLFGMVRWMRDLLTGRRSGGGLRSEFREFANGRPVQGPLPNPGPPPSKKPLIVFLLAVFGIPYAMHRLVRILSERAARNQLQAPMQSQGGQGASQLGPLDPSQLTFARAVYAFKASNPAELALAENEIVAIMGKLDPSTGAEVDPRLEIDTEWWRGRTRDGREGWFPRKWAEVLQRKAKGSDAPTSDEPSPSPDEKPSAA